LPHQLELIESEEKYVALVGGYGSAKTLAAVVLCIVLSLQIPGNVGVVVRRSYQKLHDSTQRIFLEVLERVGVSYQRRDNRDGWSHRIILPNASEIHFRETKDPGRWLGSEYGFFYIDEAGEEPLETFTGVVGRLRLPQADGFRKGIITTNPPHHTHWIAKTFGLKPGVIEKEDPETKLVTKYRLIKVSTRQNPFVPTGYIADLRATHPESEVRRIVDGEYGFTHEGKAVYCPPFSFEKHVVELVPVPNTTIIRSWDFGYHAPAVTWHQHPRCKKGNVHWLIFHEFTGEDIESEKLALEVLAETRRVAPDHPKRLILDVGDAAGAQIGEKGPGPIIRLQKPPFNLTFRKKHLKNIDPGLALVRSALAEPDCKCGKPIFQVSRELTHTINMLAGGYHYPTIRPGHAPDNVLKPVKDGFYDNIADTVRYDGENVYRVVTRDQGAIDRMMADNTSKWQAEQDNWAWMG
jgi:PBSX family phage terminase large subunit